MRAEIITIGDELLIGQVINSNQAYIAEKLTDIGIDVARMTTVGDGENVILDAFTRAWKDNEIVVVTGGLGPTHDDITKKAASRFFKSDLASHPEVRKQIESLMRKRNLSWSPAAEEQTMFPTKASVLPNIAGTAPGELFEAGGKYFFALPGVPLEMKEMIDRSVIPFLEKKSTSAIRHLTLRTTGIPESLLAQKLGSLDEVLQGAQLAFLPSPTGVRLRITVHEGDNTRAESKLREAERRIRARIEKYIYGTGEEELEETIGRMLTERRLTLAVAESCTGGLIADRITNVSGSSTYFERGIVAYSNRSKTELLKVPPAVIDRYGAVSKEVAEAMAEGVRSVSNADLGVSTTGIAGPTGGSKEKPVGLVWIGYSDASETFAMKFLFGDIRVRTKERAAAAALELLRRKLLGIE